MKKKYKKLSENVFLFSISSFLQKIISFILVPLYTLYLTLEEYGTIDLINTTINIIVPIFTLNISEAVMRFTIDDKKDDSFLSFGFFLILKSSFILFFLLFFISNISYFHNLNNYLILIWIVYLLNSIYIVMQSYLRAIGKINIVVFSSIINTFVILLSNIVFIVILKMGIYGFYISIILGFLFSVTFMFIIFDFYKHISFKKSKLDIYIKKESLKYSIPTVFTALSWWINSSLDRYFVTTLLGVVANGIYSISYKIPTILGVFQNIFTQAWTLSAITEFDSDDKDEFFGNTYQLFNAMMVISTSFILIFNNILAYILYSNDFYIAWKYVPLLLISSLFSALSGYIGSIFSAAKDTKTSAYSTILSAIINIFLNIILIPNFGLYGASISTMISYLSVWIIRITVLRKYIIIKLTLKKDLIAYCLLFIQSIIAMTDNRYYIVQLLIISIIIFIYNKTILRIFLNIINKNNKIKN